MPRCEVGARASIETEQCAFCEVEAEHDEGLQADVLQPDLRRVQTWHCSESDLHAGLLQEVHLSSLATDQPRGAVCSVPQVHGMSVSLDHAKHQVLAEPRVQPRHCQLLDRCGSLGWTSWYEVSSAVQEWSSADLFKRQHYFKSSRLLSCPWAKLLGYNSEERLFDKTQGSRFLSWATAQDCKHWLQHLPWRDLLQHLLNLHHVESVQGGTELLFISWASLPQLKPQADKCKAFVDAS